ncbi:MAG: hypothetical protein ACOZNI_14530 [Myxococcota bacterium]
MSRLSSTSRGAATGCALQLGALAILALLGVAGALVFPHLPRPSQQFVVPGVLVAWIGVVFPLLFVFVTVVTTRRNRRLDAAFGGLGPPKPVAPVERGWAGKADGRAVNAWFSKGPTVELYVAASPGTEVGVGRSHVLFEFAARASDRARVPVAGELVAMGAERAWTERMVADPAARGALLELCAADGANVMVQPDCVKLTARWIAEDEITRERVDRWVAALAAFARAVDALPSPASRIEAHPWVARRRTDRGSIGRFLAITLGCTLAMLLFAVVMTAVIVLAAG